MRKSLLYCSLFVLVLAFLLYQSLVFIDALKFTPLLNQEKCTLIPGIMGPEDIVNWHGIGLAGSDDRVKLWYGGDKMPVDAVPNGAIYAIYPSNDTKIRFKPLSLHGFPLEIAFHPHGMALYPHQLYVINHAYGKGGERIEVFDLDCCDESEGSVKLTYNYSLTFQDFHGMLNDLVAISENEIFVTQWLPIAHSVKGTHNSETIWLDMQRVFHMIFSKKTYVHYCKSNEKHEMKCKEVESTKHEMNNGIAFDRKDLMMVARPSAKMVTLFRIVEKNGEKDLVFLRDIMIDFTIDNIDYDPETNTFYVAVFGRIMDFFINEYKMFSYGKLETSKEFKSGVFAIKIKDSVEDMKPEMLYFQNELNSISVATKFKDYILLGGPFFDGVSVCYP